MRTSIILVTYNGQRYLPGCLESLLAELGAEDELILVDNASSDSSVEFVQAHWPQLRLIRNDRNIGFAAASNQAAALAQGEVLVFLNQDTQVQPGWLTRLLEGLSEEEKVGLVTSKLLFMVQPEQINLCGQEIVYTGMTFGRGTLHPAGEFDTPKEVGSISGAAFAIHRSLWKQLGGFDPDFFMYYEETDLCWRASLRGYTCRYVPGSVALHDAGLKPSPRAAYFAARNRQMMLLKHWKWPTLLLMLPGWLITELVEWGYLLRLGRGYAAGKLRAGGWLLGHLRQVLRARKNAQVGREVSDAVLLRKCSDQLRPQVMTTRVIDGLLVSLANGLLRLNYYLILRLTEWLKL
jgi:hypothetical protein